MQKRKEWRTCPYSVIKERYPIFNDETFLAQFSGLATSRENTWIELPSARGWRASGWRTVKKPGPCTAAKKRNPTIPIIMGLVRQCRPPRQWREPDSSDDSSTEGSRSEYDDDDKSDDEVVQNNENNACNEDCNPSDEFPISSEESDSIKDNSQQFATWKDARQQQLSKTLRQFGLSSLLASDFALRKSGWTQLQMSSLRLPR